MCKQTGPEKEDWHDAQFHFHRIEKRKKKLIMFLEELLGIFEVVAFDDWPLILKTSFIAFFILLILYLCKREKYNRLWKEMY